jgi:hypothetical protein
MQPHIRTVLEVPQIYDSVSWFERGGEAVAPRADYPPHPRLGLCLLVWISCLRLCVVVNCLIHVRGVSELSKLLC